MTSIHTSTSTKWLVLMENRDKYYLTPDKEKLATQVQHKNYITKVMFLVAVACPCLLLNVYLFDGKLDAWAFACQEAAKRKSKRRLASTIKWKHVKSNKEEVRRHLLQNIFLDINQKWYCGY